MKDNHVQSGANLLKGFVLNQECCFSFQSIVIKCAYTLQKDRRGLTIIKISSEFGSHLSSKWPAVC